LNTPPPGIGAKAPHHHHPRDYGRAAEAFVMLALASLTIRFVPFRRFAWWLGRVVPAPATTPSHPEAANSRMTGIGAPPPLARAVSLAVERAARRTWWEPTCLARAMAGRALLAWRGIPATVTLGVAPGKDGAPLTAHAWLVCGEATLLGGKVAPAFHPIAHFKSTTKRGPA
jgi:hypothetical protein